MPDDLDGTWKHNPEGHAASIIPGNRSNWMKMRKAFGLLPRMSLKNVGAFSRNWLLRGSHSNKYFVSSYCVPSVVFFLELGHNFSQKTVIDSAEKVLCSLFLSCFSQKFQIFCRFLFSSGFPAVTVVKLF